MIGFIFRITFLILLISNDILAVPREKKIFFKKYTQKEGLSSFRIRKIIQDPYGLIWIATQDGLNRFNGHSFTSFTRNSNFLCNDITDISLDEEMKNVWCVSPYTAIQSLSLSTEQSTFNFFLSDSSMSQLKNMWLRSITVNTKNKKIWLGTNDGLAQLEIGSNICLKNIELPFSRKKNMPFTVTNLVADSSKRIWVFCDNYGVAIYELATSKLLFVLDMQDIGIDRSETIVFNKSVYDSANNSILIASSKGLFTLEAGLTKKDIRCHKFIPIKDNIKCAGIDKTGNFWYSSNNHLYLFDVKTNQTFQIKNADKLLNSVWPGDVNHIFFDSYHNIWLATNEGVYEASTKESVLIPYTKNFPNLDNLSCQGLLQTNDSIIYATSSNGLYEFNTFSNSYKYIKSNPLYNIIQLPNKQLMIFGETGLFILSKHGENLLLIQASEIFPELFKLNSFFANNVLNQGDSVFLFSSENENGLLKWDYKKKQASILKNKDGSVLLGNDAINNIFKDRKNRIWILGDNYISKMSSDYSNLQKIKLNEGDKKQEFKIFFDMREFNDSYFLTSYGYGLIQFDKDLKFVKKSIQKMA
jgi:ligand-binding sensor domain-containing protein